ncbi:phosphonopyruvate decarboxylase [Kineothrix sp. MSJ-39]|uniref:phosphonopyruvate decarboxylase n=1 Tax=Kineothrix sp. MSJ-39 TaxID=2841533 RepID=UPI001C0F7E24|nr:phosphonopyruvate decarboxylase [Kineothrix sp. MSJ-39]MBU5431052.1 phosphonopyruvate decarboxylase [Kineothrix sp. MSJ-39]
MQVESFIKVLDSDFYTGVPDSQLKPLCNYLMNTYGIDPQHHVIAANEGNCVALATGYHLATGKIPVVYMQNSGEGNVINPIASLTNDNVYAVPMVFIVGWRGQPGIHDEPQHVYQGKITKQLLAIMDIESFVITKNTSYDELEIVMAYYRTLLAKGKSVAFIIEKGVLEYDASVAYGNNYIISREEALTYILSVSGNDPVICTTGKASREVYEIREKRRQGHGCDFLTVGSMGHSSSIALGIALQKPETKIWCIDGDGAVLMHMGAIAVIGANAPHNMVHIVINNEAHETVGGMPTVAGKTDFVAMVMACGYQYAVCVQSVQELETELKRVKTYEGLCLLEIKCRLGARDDLGRPVSSPIENKEAFMDFLDKKV